MAVIYRPTIRCDGCGQIYGDTCYDNAVMARISAHADGWQFPNRFKLDGSPATHTNDVCPNCFPDWVGHPTRKPTTGDHIRDWT